MIKQKIYVSGPIYEIFFINATIYLFKISFTVTILVILYKAEPFQIDTHNNTG